MNVNDHSWTDMSLEQVKIEFDRAEVIIIDDSCPVKQYKIVCTGLAGIPTMCLRDESIINGVYVRHVGEENDFYKYITSVYDKDFDYWGKTLKNGLEELTIELVNHTSFSIYCIDVELIEE